MQDTRRRRRRRRRRRSGAPVILTILLIAVLCGAFGAKVFLDKYSYSKEKADLNEYFSIRSGNDVPIVWGNVLSDVRALMIDGRYYIPFRDVRTNLNSRFYYGYLDANDTVGAVMYCLPTQRVQTIVGSTAIQTGANSEEAGYIPAMRVGEQLYLALDFVKRYTNFTYEVFQEPARIQIVSSFGTQTVADVTKDTQVRVSGGIKSEILTEAEKGHRVVILEQMESWSKVRTDNAFIGYIENKRLSDPETIQESAPAGFEAPQYTSKSLGTKVNLAFHNLGAAGGNSTVYSYMAPTKGVNVVAPTWFWVSSSFGDITSFAQQDYVDWVHSQGKQVWAVVDNINSKTRIDGLGKLPGDDTGEFLDTLATRTNLINQLIGQATTYGIDGINVDFEQLTENHGQGYIEFIRELSIACRNNNLFLSVDNYPPYEYNRFYDLREQGVFCDYVIIMGYDEHYVGSDEAGSVASIGYVADGIHNAQTMVPSTKLVNAVPFYSRIWKTTGTQVTSEAHGMQDIRDYIAAHNMSVTWSAEAGQNYAEVREGDTLIQIWVEDAQSIAQKIDVMRTANIAGIAEWRLDFETPDVWDVIAAYSAE